MMKFFPRFIITSLLSLLICFSMFFLVMLYLFLPENQEEKAVQKNESSIIYSAPPTTESTTLLIYIDECSVIFSVKLSPKSQNLSVGCIPKLSVNKGGHKLEDFESKASLFLFTGEEYNKKIAFSLSAFENTVNHIGGIEIETPYGLPAPAKNNTVLASGERLNVYGASLGIILTEEKHPSAERQAYYCYILGELCLKLLKECDTESYKLLNQNSKTDISYTDFYDNYKSLKSNINYAVCSPPSGQWIDGWFYLE